eukprot:CAMPEP_0185617282 /NCGR_PEP_ID=MMETSP0436-20130131/42970_1 /TAXON_ID=626734 ORGANISM="Favella taraikaensis, Strain Fe Narragansett Bay" /NCGR_SAMPLE_ID=MMETSP0436 /ASSEMBLY_ACC=CAM_ASM_000390 /LENGTH=46 /DNA_ID= /DNA_START= /DNA_END= /DNA_ORIENTATION=
MVPIEIELHEDLLDEGLIGDTIPELHHFSVLFLAVKQLVEKVRLLL